MNFTTYENPASASWAREAEAMGFAVRDGVYRLDGLRLGIVRGWPTLVAEGTACGVQGGGEGFRNGPRAWRAARGDLGRPGLWKTVAVGAGRRAAVRQVWEMPPSVLAAAGDGTGDEWPYDAAQDGQRAGAGTQQEGGDGGAQAASPFRLALAWALATAGGAAPAGWRAPQPDEVRAAVPPAGLTVRKGPFLRQGTLVCEPGRLAVAFPVLGRVPADLPAARREWLEAVLADAQTQWRLVRMGAAPAPAGADGQDEGGLCVQAEVDLTGVPAPLMAGFVRTGAAALQWVVGWVLRSVDFLTDARVACRALESA